MKIVIIGGVATGMSAAAKLKRDNPDYEIIVFEKSNEVSYAACGLPYYISGITSSDELLRIRKPEAFIKDGIDLRLNSEVISIDEKEKVVTVENKSKQYIVNYDKCIIATGGKPLLPILDGINLKNIFTLNTIKDANLIKNILDNKNTENILIVGGGYIGMELVESFLLKNKKVTIVEQNEFILNTFDPDMSQHIKDFITNKGVNVKTSEHVVKFIGDEYVKKVVTNKATYETDLVILATGILPNTQFLKNTKLELMSNGAIIVDEKMKTNIDSIYAGGDCATVYHKILKKNVYMPLATNANKQGRFIAQVLSGDDIKFDSAIGSAILKIAEVECGRTGITVNNAINNNINYETNTIKGKTGVKYYPGNEDIIIKIIYNKDTRILLGAQLVGTKDVAWRMNVLATCIHNEMTIDEIEKLDLGYAPPFSAPWDPIHIVARTTLKNK